MKPSSVLEKAENGDACAQFLLGVEFANIDGTKHDYASAFKWYLKAGEQEHVRAQLNLGIMYARGHGVPRDSAQALFWLHRAAEKGYALAQYQLGTELHRLSFDDTPVAARESRIEAYKWFQLAAAQKHPDSQAACERITMRMNHAEVSEAHQRIAAFVIRPTKDVTPGT